MKVSIITFHNTSNFGATLQCTALTKYLNLSGYDVEVVNYLPEYVLKKKSATKELKNISSAKNKIRAFVKGFAYLAHINEIKRRDYLFEQFIANNIKITHPYYNYQQLMENPPRADLYVCGSDQIWNAALTGGHLDEAFFLKYAIGKKAAYGTSLGELDIDAYADELSRLTEDFTRISVREKSVALKLSKAIGKPVEAVLDCTLLLDKEDYLQMESQNSFIDQPYVLLYNVQNSDAASAIAKKLSTQYGLLIVDISPNPFSRIRRSVKRIDIGPAEFLTLIKNARYVVTNSFHGTVFSIIYEKEFYSVAHGKRSGRLIDLLESLNLTDRMVTDPENITCEKIAYNTVKYVLKDYRQQSHEYIDRILLQK